MRFRRGRTVLGVALAAGLLAGCGGSNVGVAAKIGGTRITESQLSDYVTPKAQSVQLSVGTSTPPKSFVLYILIREQLYRALLRKTGGVPPAGKISSLINSYVGNGSPQRVVESLGVHGYAPAFAAQLLRFRAFGSVLDQRVRSGVDVQTVARKLQFPVVVNPRFGRWDSRTLSLVTAPDSGLPGYLRLQPTSGAR